MLYAADGKHYVPVANDLRRRSARVDLSELGGGPRAALRVVVSDGVLTGSDASKRHRVPAKPPRVSIATPANGAAVTEGEPVQLIASVSDPQDVPFGSSGVVWTSSLAGELGRGAAHQRHPPRGNAGDHGDGDQFARRERGRDRERRCRRRAARVHAAVAP